jgi:Flp pilus assembly protein TadG
MIPPLHRKDQRGAAAVEMAIILPLLVILVFGIVQFSILWNRSQGLHAAAREGARIGSLPQTTQDDIEEAVRDALGGVADPLDATITVSPNTTRPCDLQPPGARVVVTVTVDTEVMIPFFDGSPFTKTLEGEGEFKCE